MDEKLRRRKADSFLYRWGPALAFLTLAVAITIAMKSSADQDAEKLRQGLVESCERVNVLRRESNERIESHIIERDVVLQLTGAAKRAVVSSEDRDVRQTASDFDRLADKLEQVRFDKLALVECQKVLPKP